jgi:chromatin remodeling complex protein RSC6
LHSDRANRVNATACHNTVNNTTHCAEEWQKVCEAATGGGSNEAEGRENVCKLASLIRTQVKKNEEEQAHTPEENQRHHEAEERNKSAEEEREKASGEEQAIEESPAGKEAKHFEEKEQYENGK